MTFKVVSPEKSKAMKTKTKKQSGRDSYLKLIKQFPLRLIRNERQLDAAIAVLDGLLDRYPLAGGEKEYFDVLADLIEKYETEHIHFDTAKAIPRWCSS